MPRAPVHKKAEIMDGRPKSKLPSTKRAEIVDGRVKKDVAVS